MAGSLIRLSDRYVADVGRYPVLSREEEKDLASRYVNDRDLESGHRLVQANLRFVVKIAHEYRGYGLPLLDLVQEGNLGLIMAVKRFDPARGYRLISYAVWWIRAYIQSFIIRSWSLVKVGTTQAQRKLFYRLRSEMEEVEHRNGNGGVARTEALAARLMVPEAEVTSMELRLAGRDYSLDAEVRPGGNVSYASLLVDPGANQEEALATQELRSYVRGRVCEAMDEFNEKERYIIENRLMAEEPVTLRTIGRHFHISRERARQIQMNVVRKIKAKLGRSELESMAA